MRCLVAALLSITATGCVTSASMAIRAPVAPLAVRAESDDLEDLKKAVHTKPATEQSDKNRGEASCGSGSSAENDESSHSGQLFLAVIASPFKIPILALDDDYDHVTEFPDFPYAEDVSGSLLRDNFQSIKKQMLTGTLQTYAIPQTHDVDRFGGRLLLDSCTRFGIDAETNYWTQGLIKGPSDQLWTGDANLVFRFAESERMQWRAGVGVNWLADNIRSETGINFTYGFDWFPVRPWTVSSILDFGSLGAAGLFHHRTTVGAMIGQTEVFAGYDYFQVGSIKFQGPVAGIGWRF